MSQESNFRLDKKKTEDLNLRGHFKVDKCNLIKKDIQVTQDYLNALTAVGALMTHRFYSVQRQTILLVNGEPLGSERVNRELSNWSCRLCSAHQLISSKKFVT